MECKLSQFLTMFDAKMVWGLRGFLVLVTATYACGDVSVDEAEFVRV